MLALSEQLHSGSNFDSSLFRQYCYSIIDDDLEASLLAIEYINKYLITRDTISDEGLLACKEIAMLLYDRDFELSSSIKVIVDIILALDGKLVIPTAIYLSQLTQSYSDTLAETLLTVYTDIRIHRYPPFDVLQSLMFYKETSKVNSPLLEIIHEAITLDFDDSFSSSDSSFNLPSESLIKVLDHLPGGGTWINPSSSRYDNTFDGVTIKRTRINKEVFAAKTFSFTTEDIRSVLKEIGVSCTLNMRPIKYLHYSNQEITIFSEYYYKSLESLIYMDSTWEDRLEKWKDLWIDGKDQMFARVFIDDRIRYTKELFSILTTIHSYGIIHQDIKPDNLMIDDQHNLKLIDFGSASLFNSSPKKQLVQGSLLYQDYNTLSGNLTYSFEVDIWSAGITLLEMEVGCLPIPNTEDDLLDNIKLVIVEEIWLKQINSIVFTSLLLKMFDLDSLRRATAKECLVLFNLI